MPYEWKVGDRARCIAASTLDTERFGVVGRDYPVLYAPNLYSSILLSIEGYSRSVLASRFKPVFRVKAISRPTPETYAECRLAHGPSRYQTGHDVFKGWDDWAARHSGTMREFL